MQKTLSNKSIVFVLTFFFISLNVISSNGILLEKSSDVFINGNTFYVGGTGPGNYTTIQEAINDANPDDTIYVYNESSPYYENIVIDKSIQLIGEDRNTTVIDGNEIAPVIKVTADNTFINKFTIQKSGYFDSGILINSDYNIIVDNLVKDNCYGFFLNNSTRYNSISFNTIIGNNESGILLKDTSYNTIVENEISNNFWAIYALKSSNNNISKNIIKNSNWSGIQFRESYDNFVSENDILTNDVGIDLDDSNTTIISHNVIMNNSAPAIRIDGSYYNNIKENIIRNN